MAIKTGFETVDFTQWMDFHVSELAERGEAELINDALSEFFTYRGYEENGTTYAVGNVHNLQAKVTVSDRRARVILFGTIDLNGKISPEMVMSNV